MVAESHGLGGVRSGSYTDEARRSKIRRSREIRRKDTASIAPWTQTSQGFEPAVADSQDAAPILDEAVEILGKHPDVTVDVNGYCDIIGGVAYNQRLSERRAAAVAHYLEQKGIATSRLITHGYGKTHFVASNRTAEGRAQNRRVELVPQGQ